ncbi:MAG: zeta toxin family protein [Deltaproteobacteria bacterium]|nr:zeta toxin family protein [Deltaproteobacteria bacterium]
MAKSMMLVIAGPNGSGRTTLSSRLRIDKYSRGAELLDPDAVAREHFGDTSDAAMVEAARWVTARREELLGARKPIAFQTVFSTYEKLDFLERARRSGYYIRMFFIGTRDPRINAARVCDRVMKGGHAVPIDKLVSRFRRSMANLPLAINLVDRAYIYDNSTEDVEARLCARTYSGQLRKIYGDQPDWVADVIEGLPRHADFALADEGGED